MRRALIALCAAAGSACLPAAMAGDAGGDGGGSTAAGGASGGGSMQATGGSGGGAASTGGGSGFGGGIVAGGPGCGLASAAFCDTFDAPSSTQGRAGELDPRRWSAGRVGPQGPNDNGMAFGTHHSSFRPVRSLLDGGRGQLPQCRANLPATSPVQGDTRICDPSPDIASRHLLAAVGSQNYGSNSYRIRQPFDFAGRTGTIVFDAEANAEGLLGWVSLDVTEDPISVPSYADLRNDEGGVIPYRGFDVQLNASCFVSHGQKVGVSAVHVFDATNQTTYLPTAATCVPSAWGHLNRFQLEVSTRHIDVYATPVSADGVTFGAKQLLYAVDVMLPFSRGYVQITTHNHGTLKYTEPGSAFADGFLDVDAFIARWDNVGFDGPVIQGDDEYEVPNSLTPSNATMTSIGYLLADDPALAQPIVVPGVDPTGVTKARLAFTSWYCLGCGPPPSGFSLRYRVNGQGWHDRPLTAAEIGILSGGKSQGALGQIIDLAPGELVMGDNRIELITVGVPRNYPPGVANVDLILTR